MGRISDWIARRKQFEPAGHRVGGGMAEVRLGRLVRSVSGDAKVWDGLRIPDLENNGRREIDMVIAGKEETLFVEQKHWSGELNFKDGCFLQTQRSGNIIDHGDIHSWTERKMKLIQTIHKERTDENIVNPKVIIVLSNKNLVINNAPKNLMIMNEMDLIKYLENQNLNKPEELLIETLEGFGTWDSIHFHGGMSLNGDIMAIGLDLDDWMIEIDELKTLNISHKNKFYHLLTRINSTLEVQGEKPQLVLAFRRRHSIYMHVVGENEPREINLSYLFKIELSKRPKPWGVNPGE